MPSKEFYDDVFEQLYEEAVPGRKYFDEEDYSEEIAGNRLHYLDGERQLEIIDDLCNEYGLPPADRKKAKQTILLGKGPSTSQANVDQARNEEDLEPVSRFLEGEETGTTQ